MRKSSRLSKPYVVFCTAGSAREALAIANLLLKKRLCACANVVGNLESWFWWHGKIDRANEWLLVIKTEQAKLKPLESAIRRNHSYSVPEVIGWPIQWGSGPYLNWISKSIKS